jgi:von Willebrand factor type A domain/Aerotolerance regulator N-terminal
MFLLNFTPLEFLALFGSLVGILTALYMLGRSRHKKVVSTLRFWTSAGSAYREHSRKRMREPWSFLLQVLSLLLLLLAAGQLEWGHREQSIRKHVLLLDTSAWTSARSRNETLLNREKELASRYLSGLPLKDQVMLVGVDAFTTPMTVFTSDRTWLSTALAKLQPSYSALNMVRALEFAHRAQALSGGKEGEVVYIGPRRVQKVEGSPPSILNLRTLDVPCSNENYGIRHVGVRRDDSNPSLWHAAVTVRNYGKRARSLYLRTRLGRRAVAAHSISLGPQSESVAEYSFSQKQGESLTIDLKPDDALSIDNSVTLQLPSDSRTKLAVFTNRPQVFKPLAESDNTLSVAFFNPAQYRPNPEADVMVLDRIAPPEPPAVSSLWIAPPREGSPVPVRTVAAQGVVKDWNTDTALGTGLREKETPVRDADIFQPASDDVTVASTAEGPVIVAHSKTRDRAKFIVLGFDPVQDEARVQATVPLLFANLFRWLAPQTKQTSEVEASFVGGTIVPITSTEELRNLHVTDDAGTNIPFSIHNRLLEFFTNRPSVVVIRSEDAVRTVSPILADVAQELWVPPVHSRLGLPQSISLPPSVRDLWKWLALAGALGLLVEWFLFGEKRNSRLLRSAGQIRTHDNAPERELASR